MHQKIQKSLYRTSFKFHLIYLDHHSGSKILIYHEASKC